MKKALFLLFFFLVAQPARADVVCFCGTAVTFETWVTTGWVPFVTALGTFDTAVLTLFQAASTAAAYDGTSNAIIAQKGAKDAALANVTTKYNADNVNRQAELAMRLLEKTACQDTAPAQDEFVEK